MVFIVTENILLINYTNLLFYIYFIIIKLNKPLEVLKIFNRPISPHLSIYSIQISSIFSIWHRISGICLTLVLIIFALILKFLSFFVIDFTIIFYIYHKINNLWVINSFFLVLLFFLTYHMLNGLRHISWDLGFFLTPYGIKISSFFILLIIVFLLILTITKIII